MSYKVVFFAIFEKDGLCSRVGSGPKLPSGAVELPEDHHVSQGAYRNMYDETWHFKPLSALVALGRASLEPGYKLEGNTPVPMTLEELSAANPDLVDKRHVLEGKGPDAYIREKHPFELWRDGVEDTPPGVVVEDDETVPIIKLRVRPKTYDEQVATNELAAEVAYSLKLRDWEVARKAAYADESDPLLAEMLRGQVNQRLGRVPTLNDVNAAADAVKARHPKPASYV